MSRIPTKVVAVAAVALAACNESESNPLAPNGGTDALNAIVISAAINAGSTDTLVYFSLANNAVVQKSAEWDVALRRYEVRLNGGISGTRGVTGYSMGNNKSATNPQILALTASNTLAAFDSVRTGRVPAESEFKSDRLVENKTGWLNLAGVPSANSAAYWKVRTASNGFAVVHATAAVLSQSFALTSVTLESRMQTGAGVGSARSLQVPLAGGPAFVNLETNQVVAAQGCNWDLRIDPADFGISVNAACNAGTYPGGATPTFAALSAANDAPQYGAFLSGITGPVPNSVTDAEAPFRYNISGDNRLSPTFNTYLVNTGARVYKLQVINYYSAAGASGFPTLRFARIR